MFISPPPPLLWINLYFSKVIQMHRKCTDVFVFSGEKGDNNFEGLLNFTSLGLGNSISREVTFENKCFMN